MIRVPKLGENHLPKFASFCNELTAKTIPFGISSLSVQQGGNTGEVTLEIKGSQFDAFTTLELVGQGETIKATWLKVVDASRILVTFDLTGKALGQYDLRAVSKRDEIDIDASTGLAYKKAIVNGEATLTRAFSVVAGSEAGLKANFSMPSAARGGSPFTFYLDVVNQGNTDMAVPVYQISSLNGITIATSPNEQRTAQTQVMLLGNLKSTVLSPGESVRIALYGVATSGGTAEFALTDLSAREQKIDWDSVEATYKNYQVNPNWAQTWANFKGIIGDTWQSLYQVMRQVSPDLVSSENSQFVTGSTLILSLLSWARNGVSSPNFFNTSSSDERIDLLLYKNI